MLLVDTDVLIDFLKGVPEAVSYLNSLAIPPSISAVTVAELMRVCATMNDRC